MTFADHVRDLDTLERGGGRREGLEARHRSDPFLDRTVVLLDRVIKVFYPDHLDRGPAAERL